MESNYRIPATTKKKFSETLAIIESFSQEYLNEEYKEVSVKLLVSLARKRPSPLLSGKRETWAAGIIHALGMVNFLFDKSKAPHVTSKELCQWFGLSQSTVSAKSKSIRDMFKISQFDPKWTLPSRFKDNPMMWMVSMDGLIVDARRLSYELQVEAFEAGVIPFIPADMGIK